MRSRIHSALVIALILVTGCVVEEPLPVCGNYDKRCGDMNGYEYVEKCTSGGYDWRMAKNCPWGCLDGTCLTANGMPEAEEGELGPGAPPQEPGNDLNGVQVRGTGGLGAGSLRVELEPNAQFVVRAGQFFEPKNGHHQRMMVPVNVTISTPGIHLIDAHCMQPGKSTPSDNAAFFSEPKSPSGEVQECQRNCGQVQSCIWNCL